MLTGIKTSITSVSSFIKLFEKLLSARQTRKEASFEEFIRPLHHKFLEVHVDYCEIFKNFKYDLPHKFIDKLHSPEGKQVSPSNAASIVKKAIGNYKKARKQQESIRDILIDQAKSILHVIENTEERRYVYSLISYFHEHPQGDHQNNECLDNNIAVILSVGGDHALNSPSTRLLEEIDGIDHHEIILEKIRFASNELNQRFSNVNKTYVELQYRLIQGKS